MLATSEPRALARGGGLDAEPEMPARSEKQRRFMGAELSRKRAGKKTKTKMSEGQLEDYAEGSSTSARQQMRALENYEPPDSADDLDRRSRKRGARRA